VSYTYDSIVTYDPNTNRLIKNAPGNVYDPADTEYATPLTVTDLDGNTLENITSNDSGVLPQFVSEVPRVRWKAADFPPVEIGSPQTYADAAVAAQAAAEAAQAAAEAAANGGITVVDNGDYYTLTIAGG
jgi:hypothetical protein